MAHAVNTVSSMAVQIKPFVWDCVIHMVGIQGCVVLKIASKFVVGKECVGVIIKNSKRRRMRLLLTLMRMMVYTQ